MVYCVSSDIHSKRIAQFWNTYTWQIHGAGFWKYRFCFSRMDIFCIWKQSKLHLQSCISSSHEIILQYPSIGIVTSSGPLIAKLLDFLSPNLVKTQSREVGWHNDCMALIIWQASRQHCCQGACQIWERLEKSRSATRGSRPHKILRQDVHEISLKQWKRLHILLIHSQTSTAAPLKLKNG